MDPIFRNRPGKIRLEVGWQLSLFYLTEPSSPERVGDYVMGATYAANSVTGNLAVVPMCIMRVLK
jgi:hypothetical protein